MARPRRKIHVVGENPPFIRFFRPESRSHALSQYLFQSVPPYDARGAGRDTMNGNDGIAKQAGDGAFAAVRETTTRYEADLVVGSIRMRNRGAVCVRQSGRVARKPDRQGAVAPFVPPVKR